MRQTSDPIVRWLKSTALIAEFCTQNGWIDDDTLRYEARERDDEHLLINVYFTEVVMEGSGCVADRVDCFGQMALRLDDRGEVVGAHAI